MQLWSAFDLGRWSQETSENGQIEVSTCLDTPPTMWRNERLQHCEFPSDVITHEDRVLLTPQSSQSVTSY